MVNYTCPNCQKEFGKKYNFDMHTKNKKKPCNNINTTSSQNLTTSSQNLTFLAEKNELSSVNVEFNKNTDSINNENTCLYCGLVCKRKDNLKRHINNFCKVKKEKDDEKKKHDDEINELKKLIEEQSKKIEKLSKKSKTKNINNIVVNNNNLDNSTKTVNLMAHGSEDFSKIELKSILNCLATEDFQGIIPNMAKQIFIDGTNPEFHNFKVLDISRNKSEFYDGKNWIVGKADDGLLKIFENVNNVLTEPFDKNKLEKTIKFIESNDELKKKTKWINWAKNYCNNLWSESDEEYMGERKLILEKLKLIFFNYKDQILAC
jgi:hypothetical protein